MNDWTKDVGEVARLLSWLVEQGEVFTVDQAAYVVEKPWKWARERSAMLAQEAMAA